MTAGREMSFNRAVDSRANFHNWGLKGQRKWVGIELSWLVIRMVLLSISFIQLHNYKWGPLYAYDLTDACSIECAHACSLKHICVSVWHIGFYTIMEHNNIILIYILVFCKPSLDLDFNVWDFVFYLAIENMYPYLLNKFKTGYLKMFLNSNID